MRGWLFFSQIFMFCLRNVAKKRKLELFEAIFDFKELQFLLRIERRQLFLKKEKEDNGGIILLRWNC